MLIFLLFRFLIPFTAVSGLLKGWSSGSFTITSPTQLGLNRIFFESNEIGHDRTVVLDRDDYRFQHIDKVLRLETGDSLKVGVVDVGMADFGRLVSRTKFNMTLSLGDASSMVVSRNAPAVDLLLAVPRPLRLERLLPVVACMGVNKLVLLDAAKVEKDYFGSHLFRRPNEVRSGFIEGLSQAACDFVLPEILVRRRLHNFLENELDQLFPTHTHLRVIAHPSSVGNTPPRRFNTLSRQQPSQSKVVVAVGPEGGWEDSEIELFSKKGFEIVSLGERILRTDMAVPVLLGLAGELAESFGTKEERV